jgi:hypothetical protein
MITKEIKAREAKTKLFSSVNPDSSRAYAGILLASRFSSPTRARRQARVRPSAARATLPPQRPCHEGLSRPLRSARPAIHARLASSRRDGLFGTNRHHSMDSENMKQKSGAYSVSCWSGRYRLCFRTPLDRGREGFRLLSLRTVRAVFPHTALQSGVSVIETVSPTARPCETRTARLPQRRRLASVDDRLDSIPCPTTASLVFAEGRAAAGE